jgi:hypothetical protein
MQSLEMSSNGADRHLRSNCAAGEMLFGGFVFFSGQKNWEKNSGTGGKVGGCSRDVTAIFFFLGKSKIFCS